MSSPRYALISVSNRTNLDKIAAHLVSVGFTLLTTTGSKKFLDEIGVASVAVEDFTTQREILGGRVKTLHPKIHGGILAKRGNADHQADLLQEGIPPIDVVIVNLYPFLDHVRSDTATDPDKMVELIDIGGPTMIRAAAKNFRSVLALIDPNDYEKVIPLITAAAGVSGVPLDLRRQLSVKVFASLARYNLEIARYLSTVSFEGEAGKVNEILFPEIDGVVLERKQELRYGENPQQSAAFYMPLNEQQGNWRQLQGKELSYNNLLDFDSIVRMLKTIAASQALAIIVKHLNPCGMALAETPVRALERAKLCDPRSHFGGIIGFNQTVDAETARNVAEDFAEIIVAPEFSQDALAILSSKKNLRVLRVSLNSSNAVEFRSVESGMLLQTSDKAVSLFSEAEQVSGEPVAKSMKSDLELAWAACAHVKSNAVVIVKEGMLVGTGAGQMSRIDSTELALSKASFHKHDLVGAVAASDAFFPFADSLELLAERGIKAVIAPKGSRADAEVIETAKRLGVALFFTNDRHFRH
jgi:phosphoribosylaminoimidazolecarboxamide formyltransferase / IMP cyclohydrolase